MIQKLDPCKCKLNVVCATATINAAGIWGQLISVFTLTSIQKPFLGTHLVSVFSMISGILSRTSLLCIGILLLSNNHICEIKEKVIAEV